MNGRLIRFVIIVGVIILGVFLAIILVGAVNCVMTGRTCPPQGAVREMIEDVFMALLGFVGGRATAQK